MGIRDPKPMLSIHVPFRPVPQKRHRHTRAGRTYDPCTAEKAAFLKLCLQDRRPIPAMHGVALHCTLRFTFARPVSHCTPKGFLKRTAPRMHVYKPDADNLAKFVLDALNGQYYKDDSQISVLIIEKRYGDEDSVHVQLRQHTVTDALSSSESHLATTA